MFGDEDGGSIFGDSAWWWVEVDLFWVMEGSVRWWKVLVGGRLLYSNSRGKDIQYGAFIKIVDG